MLFLLACHLGFEAASPWASTAELPVAAAGPREDAGGDWFGAVWSRIAAEARAIHPRDGAFALDLPGLGLGARLDADGVVIAGAEEGEVLALRTTAWGRAGALVPVGGREAALGACTPAVGADGACIPRLEYADPKLTEWWVGLGTGLEQGWTVEVAPPGEGWLTLEVAVEGALSVDGGGGGATITDAAGRAWDVGSVSAYDADGEPLEAWVVVTEEGLRVEVDDAGARYPLEIDPVYSTASSTLDAEASNNAFGFSVSGAGDVNGDGYDDVLVGAWAYSSSTGRVYVYLGSPAGVSTTASTTLTGPDTSSLFGYSASGAGDVNNDGYDDVIVGAYGSGSFRGRVYVYLGSSTGVATTPSNTLAGASRDDQFGGSVSGAGDVDNDGYDDVIVGATGAASSKGRAYVYMGDATGVPGTTSLTLTGETSGDRFGLSVSGAGDVDNDGYDDVIVGAAGYGSSDGRVYVYLGSSVGVSVTADTTLPATTASEQFGYAVSGAGDVDNDGYDDVLVGAYGYNSSTGRVYVYPGGSTGLSGTASATLDGETAGDRFGLSVSGAGDVDDDGYDDVIVGADSYSSRAGRVYVYLGSSTGVSATANTTLTGASASDYLGVSVSGAGDVNGDGYDDVVVGAYGYSRYAGRAYVHLGYADEDGDGYATTEDCDDGDAAVNPGATEVCDALDLDEDCDGLADDADDSVSSATTSTYYRDGDGDGHGGTSTGSYCELPPGYTTTSTDCDDGDPAVHPGAAEAVGDELDSDCDGAEICYVDGDGDGYVADTSTVVSSDADCTDAGEAPASALPGDCDDGDAAYHPGATEADCADPNDYNCDGSTLYADADADGFAACEECDDGVEAVNPDATEVCNGVDDNCDGVTDEDAVDRTTWYADADGDGYTDLDAPLVACDPPKGYAAATEEDCDDEDVASFPGAEEVPDDGVDQDCDGADLVSGDSGDTGDTGDTGDDSGVDDPGEEDKGAGCGCASGGGDVSLAPLVLLAFAVGRRRARSGGSAGLIARGRAATCDVR